MNVEKLKEITKILVISRLKDSSIITLDSMLPTPQQIVCQVII